MPYAQGVSFRATVGYVTDGPTDWAEVSTGIDFPTTTTQGNTVGWNITPAGAVDRNNGIDPRLAGIGYAQGFTPLDFSFLMPDAGAKRISCAAGDASFNNSIFLEVFDTSTSLGVLITDKVQTAGNFNDANDVTHSAANWPANNTSIKKTFSTTLCKFNISASAGGAAYVIAYLRVEDDDPRFGVALASRGDEKNVPPHLLGAKDDGKWDHAKSVDNWW